MLLQRCNQMLIAFAIVFVCCEFGQKLGKAFEKIDLDVGRLHWYKYPVEIWKMLPIFMVGVQEPAALRVFGSIFCARGDFKNVRIFIKMKFRNYYRALAK